MVELLLKSYLGVSLRALGLGFKFIDVGVPFVQFCLHFFDIGLAFVHFSLLLVLFWFAVVARLPVSFVRLPRLSSSTS